MVADAFRIAFEQQLRKRSEHFLLLAEANTMKLHHYKGEGKSAVSISSGNLNLVHIPVTYRIRDVDSLSNHMVRAVMNLEFFKNWKVSQLSSRLKKKGSS